MSTTKLTVETLMREIKRGERKQRAGRTLLRVIRKLASECGHEIILVAQQGERALRTER